MVVESLPLPTNYKYCGAFLRGVAYIFDSMILCILTLPLIMFVMPVYWDGREPSFTEAGGMFLLIMISILYCSIFVSSKMQATPAQYWLGIKVITIDGNRVKILRSIARFVAYSFLSMIPFVGIINMLCIIFTKEKKGLHDMICGTRVVMR